MRSDTPHLTRFSQRRKRSSRSTGSRSAGSRATGSRSTGSGRLSDRTRPRHHARQGWRRTQSHLGGRRPRDGRRCSRWTDGGTRRGTARRRGPRRRHPWWSGHGRSRGRRHPRRSGHGGSPTRPARWRWRGRRTGGHSRRWRWGRYVAGRGRLGSQRPTTVGKGTHNGIAGHVSSAPRAASHHVSLPSTISDCKRE